MQNFQTKLRCLKEETREHEEFWTIVRKEMSELDLENQILVHDFQVTSIHAAMEKQSSRKDIVMPFLLTFCRVDEISIITLVIRL